MNETSMPRERKLEKVDFKLKRGCHSPWDWHEDPMPGSVAVASKERRSALARGVARPCYISSCSSNYLVAATVRLI